MNNTGDNAAEFLMLTAVAHACPDCRIEQIFVPVDEDCRDYCEFCCTVCGAAIMIDPAFDYSPAQTRARSVA